MNDDAGAIEAFAGTGYGLPISMNSVPSRYSGVRDAGPMILTVWPCSRSWAARFTM